MARRCKHGKLKKPYRDSKTGRMRYCKRKRSSRRRHRR